MLGGTPGGRGADLYVDDEDAVQAREIVSALFRGPVTGGGQVFRWPSPVVPCRALNVAA